MTFFFFLFVTESENYFMYACLYYVPHPKDFGGYLIWLLILVYIHTGFRGWGNYKTFTPGVWNLFG